jgi:hypothetical protein
MKQIDLSCKVVAPAIAGFFVAIFDDGQTKNGGYDLIGAAVLVGVLNALALVVELACTTQIYKDVPALAFKRVSPAFINDKGSKLDVESGRNSAERAHKRGCFLVMPEALKVYLDVDVSVAGIGLSLL